MQAAQLHHTYPGMQQGAHARSAGPEWLFLSHVRERTVDDWPHGVIGVLLQAQRVLQLGHRVAHGVALRVMHVHLRIQASTMCSSLAGGSDKLSYQPQALLWAGSMRCRQQPWPLRTH